jgi:hypothetical protein
MKYKKLDVVERSTNSKTVEEPTRIAGVREAGDVATPATLDSYTPTTEMIKGQ